MGYDSCQDRDFNGTDYDEAVSELLCGMPARHTAEYMLTNARMNQGDDFILRSIQGRIRTYDFQNGWLWLSPESTPELFLNDDTSLTIYNPNGTPAAALEFCRGVPETLNQQEVKL